MSQKFALIIGNSEYEDGNLARLVTPGADVDTLAEVLRSPEIGGFDEVTALVNQPGTTIRRAISAFFIGRGQDDLLLLYFSGHGIRDDRGQLFLAVKDTEHKLLRGTGIPAGFITEEMDNSRSRRQVLILDCCHSGAFSSGMKAAAGDSVGTAALFEGTGSGRVVLTATDSTQYAWEGDRVIGQAENSVFTHHLIQGLVTGAADADADGKITLDELYNYVYEQVVYETPLQTPGKWSYGQRGEIVIARNPHPVVRLVELPPDLQQTIDDPRPWVREGAVQELDRILRGSNPGMALTACAALKRLSEDDSRRVAGTASQYLAEYDAAQLVKDALQARPQAPSSHSQPVGPERSASEAPEQPPLARANTATEVPAAVQARPAVIIRDPLAAFRGLPWSSILIFVVGWAACLGFGFVITQSDDSPIGGFFVGVIGGLLLSLALSQAKVPIHWKQTLIITAGWAVGVALEWGSYSLLDRFFGAIGWSSNSALVGATGGLIGGLATALVLHWVKPGLYWKQALMITLGWVAGGLILGFFYMTFISDIGSTIPLLLFGAFLGAIDAAVGGMVMFSQLDFG